MPRYTQQKVDATVEIMRGQLDRAGRVSFERLARELGISAPTLRKWWTDAGGADPLPEPEPDPGEDLRRASWLLDPETAPGDVRRYQLAELRRLRAAAEEGSSWTAVARLASEERALVDAVRQDAADDDGTPPNEQETAEMFADVAQQYEGPRVMRLMLGLLAEAGARGLLEEMGDEIGRLLGGGE